MTNLNRDAGWLTGLVDLNTERENVQDRIAEYLTYLISVGFSGFRVDAAKHMKPDDLVAIFGKLKANLGGELPADFISWWEILLGGESDLLMCNSESGYDYGALFFSLLFALLSVCPQLISSLSPPPFSPSQGITTAVTC